MKVGESIRSGLKWNHAGVHSLSVAIQCVLGRHCEGSKRRLHASKVLGEKNVNVLYLLMIYCWWQTVKSPYECTYWTRH